MKLDLEHPTGQFICLIMVMAICALSVVLSLCISGDIHKLNCSVNCDQKKDDA